MDSRSYAPWVKAAKWRIATILFLFHFFLSFALSSIAHSTYFRSLHNGSGLWYFAFDSIGYNSKAVDLLSCLSGGECTGIFTTAVSANAKLIAVSYTLFGVDPFALAPFNALVWTLSWFGIFFIAKHMGAKNDTAAAGIALFFNMLPVNLALSTQLLKFPFFNFGIILFLLGWTGLFCTRNKHALYISSIVVGLIVVSAFRIQQIPLLLILTACAVIITLCRSWRIGLGIFVSLLLSFSVYYSFNSLLTQKPLTTEKHFRGGKIISVNRSTGVIKLTTSYPIKTAKGMEQSIGSVFPLKINADTTITVNRHYRELADLTKGQTLTLVYYYDESGTGVATVLHASDKNADHYNLNEETTASRVILSTQNFIKNILQEKYTSNMDEIISSWILKGPWPDSALNASILVNLALNHRAGLVKFITNFNRAWTKSAWIPPTLERHVIAANMYRDSFLTYYLIDDPGSNIDTDVLFRSIKDIISYLPRCLQIVVFSPFPNMWQNTKTQSNQGIRQISGAETILIYILWFGFIIYLWQRKGQTGFKLWLLLFISVMIIPLGLFVPNIGTLYRMRFIFLIPIIVGGAIGLLSLRHGRNTIN